MGIRKPSTTRKTKIFWRLFPRKNFSFSQNLFHRHI